jgi:hypothetical protein
MRLPIPGIIDIPGIVDPVAPALQPGAGVEAFAAQGVPWDVAEAASSSSGTATQPPSAADNGTRSATARRKPEDLFVTGMQWCPFGFGAGPALMLPDRESAKDAVPSTIFGKG